MVWSAEYTRRKEEWYRNQVENLQDVQKNFNIISRGRARVGLRGLKQPFVMPCNDIIRATHVVSYKLKFTDLELKLYHAAYGMPLWTKNRLSPRCIAILNLHSSILDDLSYVYMVTTDFLVCNDITEQHIIINQQHGLLLPRHSMCAGNSFAVVL